jgi:hypothetical protein
MVCIWQVLYVCVCLCMHALHIHTHTHTHTHKRTHQACKSQTRAASQTHTYMHTHIAHTHTHKHKHTHTRSASHRRGPGIRVRATQLGHPRQPTLLCPRLCIHEPRLVILGTSPRAGCTCICRREWHHVLRVASCGPQPCWCVRRASNRRHEALCSVARGTCEV